MMTKKKVAVVLMGVSGSGKTSVGESLSQATGWPFFDGDNYHPIENVEKMANGVPLNDKDRQPWLDRLRELNDEYLEKDRSLIVACSALKETYRDTLRGTREADVLFVHLAGSFELIFERMSEREGHYMKAEMLQSQFQTLEDPKDAIEIAIDYDVAKITREILNKIQDRQGE